MAADGLASGTSGQPVANASTSPSHNAQGNPLMNTSSTQTTSNLVSASYINLPALRSKQAPKEFKGDHRRLDRFLDHFEQVCAQYHVTDSSQKCRGLLGYCSDKVADSVENLDSYIHQDYDTLVKDLRWLYDGDRKKSEYHMGDLAKFIKEWNKEVIHNLETFKEYHQEFLDIGGTLKTAGQIGEKEYFRWFWAGLHDDTRDRLERRMTTEEPDLDVETPFSIDKVIKAAEHVFNRKRFDKFLIEKGEETRSRDRKGRKSLQSRRRQKDHESDEESETEDEEPAPRRSRNRVSEKNKAGPTEKRPESVRAKVDRDEINQLVKAMEGLHISEPRYRTLYAQLQLLSESTCRLYKEPAVAAPRAYLSQETRFENRERVRDPPPHQNLPPNDRGFGDRREFICYGCGARGHRMDQCNKIEEFINTGRIRRIMGKLRWSDATTIVREPTETWVDAIRRRERAEKEDAESKNKSVYYVEIAREDSDAGTDDQEELGWRSGTTPVYHAKSYGADRYPRISKEVRKETQTNSRPGPHRVKEFAPRGHLNVADREKDAIAKDPRFNRSQNRFQSPPTPTPIDISPRKFEGKLDGEFVPMDVEDTIVDKAVKDRRETSTRNEEGTVRHVAQARTIKGKTQSAVINELLDSKLTICLKDLVSLSPNVRQGLVSTLKAMRDDVLEETGTNRLEKEASTEKKTGVKVMRAGGRREEGIQVERREERLVKKKADVPRIKATIGDATMYGIVDSGSNSNVISADMAEATGLPIVPLGGKSFSVTGLNGDPIRCKYWIPNAALYLTDSKLVTYADLHVIEGVDCDLLYGRDWAVNNGVGIQERERGTYVSWISNGTPYELNVTRKGTEPIETRDRGIDLCLTNEDEPEDDEETSALSMMVRTKRGPPTDLSYAPDSETSQLAPELNKAREFSSEGEKDADDVVRWARDRVTDWKRKKEEEEAAEADDEGMPERELAPSPDLLDKGKGRARDEEGVRQKKRRRRVGRVREGPIEVDRDLEEEFTKLVQDEADDREWKTFCAKEGRRIARKNKEWLQWIEGDGEEEEGEVVTPEPSEVVELANEINEPNQSRRRPPEPSTTLKTHPEKVTDPVRVKKEPKMQPITTETSVRRSERTKFLTERGRYGEEQKKRSYQRKEKSSRTITKRARRENGDSSPEPEKQPQRVSFCIKIVADEEEETETQDARRRKSKRQDRPKEKQLPRIPPIELEPMRPPVDQHVRFQEPVKPLRISTTDRENYGIGQATSRDRGKHRQRPGLTIRIPGVGPIDNNEPPVIPLGGSIDGLEDADATNDELSIFRPVLSMVSNRNVEEEDELTYEQDPRDRRPRPDSGVEPYRHGFWATDQPSVGERELVDTSLPQLVAASLEARRNVDVWNRGRKESESEKREEPYQAEWVPEIRHAGTNESGPTTRSVLPDSVAFDLGKYIRNPLGPLNEEDSPEDEASRLRRTLKHRKWEEDLRKRYQEGEEEIESTRAKRDSPATSHREDVAETDKGKCAEKPKKGMDERRPVGRPRKTGANPKESGNSKGGPTCEDKKDIKTRKENRRKDNPPIWHQKVVQYLQPSTTTRRHLFLSISTALVTLILSQIALGPPMGRRPTTSPPQAPPTEGKPSAGGSRPGDVSELVHKHPVNPYHLTPGTDRAIEQDIPKAVLDTIEAPPIDSMIPGIIAARHFVPLAVGSSRPIREYVARAGTVSIRLTTGRIMHYRGDLHLRLFEKGNDQGWGPIEVPSRKEVGLMRGILFREGPYEGLMERIKTEYKGVQPFLDGAATGRIEEIYDEQKRVSEERETGPRTNEPLEPPPPLRKIGPPKRPGKANPTTHENWETDDKKPVKVGPRAKRSKPFNTKMLPETSAPTREGSVVRIKEEEDEDRPYRLGLLARAAIPDLSQPMIAAVPAPVSQGVPGAFPPDLVYPQENKDEPMVEEGKEEESGPSRQYISHNPEESIRLTNTPTEHARPLQEVLPEVILLMQKLQYEIGLALNEETRELTRTIERKSWNMLEWAHARKERRAKDKDGDVDMEGEDQPEGKDVVPDYSPTSPKQDSPENVSFAPTASTLRIEEVEEKMQEVEKEMRDAQWKALGRETRFEERVSFLEARLAALEVGAEEGGEPWVKVKSPRQRKEPYDRPTTRSMAPRFEEKVDAVASDVDGLRSRIAGVEEVAKEIETVREKIGKIEINMAGVRGGATAGEKRIEDLENKWAEVRLRLSLMARDTIQNKLQLSICSPQRINRIENRVLGVEYRASTLEEQLIWSDQKLRGFWHALSAPTSADAVVRTAALSLIWAHADDLYKQRVAGGPPSLVDPRSKTESETLPTTSPTTSSDDPRPQARTSQNPANTY